MKDLFEIACEVAEENNISVDIDDIELIENPFFDHELGQNISLFFDAFFHNPQKNPHSFLLNHPNFTKRGPHYLFCLGYKERHENKNKKEALHYYEESYNLDKSNSLLIEELSSLYLAVSKYRKALPLFLDLYSYAPKEDLAFTIILLKIELNRLEKLEDYIASGLNKSRRSLKLIELCKLLENGDVAQFLTIKEDLQKVTENKYHALINDAIQPLCINNRDDILVGLIEED